VYIELTHKFVRFFLTLPNNLFSTEIIKQSINYVLSAIIYDYLPTFGQIFDPTLEEIRRFSREGVVEPIAFLLKETLRRLLETERGRW
jgi:hypothetical protein